MEIRKNTLKKTETGVEKTDCSGSGASRRYFVGPRTEKAGKERKLVPGALLRETAWGKGSEGDGTEDRIRKLGFS